MRYFPIFLDLKDRQVVVVGGGEEALRKVRLLLKTEARIAVVAAELHPELAAESRVTWLAKSYAPGHLADSVLVYAADAGVNDVVSRDAAARGIPVNVVDDPDNSTFIVPSIVDRDPLVVAIGTEGTAPMLGQGLRARIDAMLPLALGSLARAGADLRSRVAARIPAGHPRRSFWTRFFFGDVRDAFVAGESVNYLAGVETLFAAAEAPVIGRVTFVGTGSHDAELLTIRAQRSLLEADVIVHDRAVSAEVLETARRDAVRIPVDGRLFDGTDQILIREARAGKRVVRLSCQEPSLEETVAVAAEGVAFETLPGVAAGRESREEPFPTQDALSDAILRAAS